MAKNEKERPTLGGFIKTLRKSLLYPIVVMAIDIIVVIYLCVKVVPTFEDVFSSFGAQLPWQTQIIVKTSAFLRTPLGLITGLGVLGLLGYAFNKVIIQKSETERMAVISRIEPFLIIFLGLTIMFIVWAMFTPMFGLGNFTR